jgi:hypothetical protein
VIPPVVAKPVKTLNLQKFSVSGKWEPFAKGLIYLEGHKLEAFLLAKIRLLVFFRGVFLPKFILSTPFESLDFLLVAELYVNPPRIQKALERYFECRISWLVLAGWRVPCSYNFGVMLEPNSQALVVLTFIKPEVIPFNECPHDTVNVIDRELVLLVDLPLIHSSCVLC